MRSTGLVLDRRFMEHDTGRMHPERPERLAVLEALFAEPRYRDLPRIEARHAEEAELLRGHSREHVAAVAASAGRGHTRFDADTPAGDRSFDAARLAVGSSMALADAIVAGDVDNGFAAVRPPGHHAESTRPMGFCLFNNVALVARHLRERHGLGRILILDWDVHHGNGTQHAFEDEAETLYASLHQYPFYPGTGGPSEVGHGAGAGYTVNVPLEAGEAGDSYLAAFREIVVPIARAFAPDFVLVSAGFDAHAADPLASMRLDESAFAEMTRAIVEVADESANGRLQLLLEGGYDLGALASSVAAVVDELRDPAPFAAEGGELSSLAGEARSALAPHWDSI